MNLELNKKYNFFGKVDNINQGEKFANINLILEDGSKINVKTTPEDIDNYSMYKVYFFKTTCMLREEKLYLHVEESKSIYSYIKRMDRLEAIMRMFYDYAPVEQEQIRNEIICFMDSITNPDIKLVTKTIYTKHEKEFYLYPAATKYHHAYIGGLSYHTLSMLKLAASIIPIYPYLNKDLLYAGIILHDMGKIEELSDAEGPEYTLKGHLIGHLILESNEIERTAQKLNLCESEAVILLNHMIISSHGNPLFGAAKRPMIPEALLLWYIDTIDSKMTVIGEEFLNLKDNEFTTPINVLDKGKMYKHKL